MRIIVADDHPLYREAVSLQIMRAFKEAEVDQVSSVDELRALAERSAYDLFLMDYHMPGMSVAAITQLVADFPAIPLAIVSGTSQRAEIRAALQAGARGFLPKTATGEHIAHAVKLLLSGGTSVPVELLQPDPPVTVDESSKWLALLTPREQQVLRGVGRGLSNKEIGRELELAEVTIKLHLRGVFRKMNARSRSDAAVMAAKAGLV